MISMTKLKTNTKRHYNDDFRKRPSDGITTTTYEFNGGSFLALTPLHTYKAWFLYDQNLCVCVWGGGGGQGLVNGVDWVQFSSHMNRNYHQKNFDCLI